MTYYKAYIKWRYKMKICNILLTLMMTTALAPNTVFASDTPDTKTDTKTDTKDDPNILLESLSKPRDLSVLDRLILVEKIFNSDLNMVEEKHSYTLFAASALGLNNDIEKILLNKTTEELAQMSPTEKFKFFQNHAYFNLDDPAQLTEDQAAEIRKAIDNRKKGFNKAIESGSADALSYMEYVNLIQNSSKRRHFLDLEAISRNKRNQKAFIEQATLTQKLIEDGYIEDPTKDPEWNAMMNSTLTGN